VEINIKGYEGYYKISNEGIIYSVDRIITNSLGRTYFLKGQKIKPINHSTGYHVIRLSKNGKTKTHRVHRVIAENLIENPEGKPYVNHKDGNRCNNPVNNLEWVTAQENTDHAILNSLFKPEGFSNAFCRFTIKDAYDMLRLKEDGYLFKDIAKLYYCHPSTVSKTINRIKGECYESK